jgi:hypothetical protein
VGARVARLGLDVLSVALHPRSIWRSAAPVWRRLATRPVRQVSRQFAVSMPVSPKRRLSDCNDKYHINRSLEMARSRTARNGILILGGALAGAYGPPPPLAPPDQAARLLSLREPRAQRRRRRPLRRAPRPRPRLLRRPDLRAAPPVTPTRPPLQPASLRSDDMLRVEGDFR